MNKQITIEDKSRIKSITFHYPELMNSNSESTIRDKYNNLLNLRNEISKQSKYLTELQIKLENAQKEFNNISNLFTIEFEKVSKEYKLNHNTVMIQNHGNDIIGKTSKL